MAHAQEAARSGDDAEATLKRDLALACRILAANGHRDFIWGHMSARLPDWDRFWMKGHTLGLEEIGEPDLVLVDLDGNVLAGERPRHSEYPIHAEIMRARPDVLAVVHTHPRHSVALAARGLELRPIGHEGSMFWPPGVPIFDEFTELVTTRAQGERVAKKLGDCRALFLLNHGVAVAGGSIAEACCAAIILERAAEVQLLAQPTADTPVRHTPAEEAERKRAIWGARNLDRMFEYLVRALRAAEG